MSKPFCFNFSQLKTLSGEWYAESDHFQWTYHTLESEHLTGYGTQEVIPFCKSHTPESESKFVNISREIAQKMKIFYELELGPGVYEFIKQTNSK